jgi:hypothetical protein
MEFWINMKVIYQCDTPIISDVCNVREKQIKADKLVEVLA